MSNNPSITDVSSIKESIDKIAKVRIDYKNVKGFFVSRERLSEIGNEIMELIDNDQDSDRAELQNLRIELEALAAANTSSHSKLTDVETRSTTLKEQLDEACKAKEEAQRILKEFRSTTLSEKAALREQLDLVKAQLATEKINSKKPAAKFDEEEAVRNSEALARLRLEVQSKNDALSEMNSAQAKFQSTFNASIKKRDTIARELESVKADLKRLSEARNKAEEIVPIDPPIVSEFHPLVTKLFGEKGKKWLQEAVEAEHHNIRDRVFKLMMAAKSGHDKSLKSMFSLFEVVFNWIKNNSLNKVKKITSWVDEVTKDMVANTMKSAKVYREKLEKLIGEIKAQSVVVRTKVEQGYRKSRKDFTTYSDHAFAWFKVLRNRFVRKTKIAVQQISKSVQSLASYVSSWFKSAPKEVTTDKEVIFDADDLSTPSNEGIHMEIKND